MDINNIKTAYFIGIGGIGMSALARFLNNRGVSVSGYDRTETTLTKNLVSEGINVHYEANTSLIPSNVDVVVYTPAVPEDFEEWKYIYEKKFLVVKRSAFLASIVNSLKSIAVSGTHGKTTVSAMIAHTLQSLEAPFIGFVGGILCKYNKNIFINKDPKWAVVEADEYDRSFLALNPYTSVINAIDADHLDIYGNLESLEASFSQFASQTSADGKVLIYDKIQESKLTLPKNTVKYGFNNKEGFSARNIAVANRKFVFDIFIDDKLFYNGVKMSIAGRHNIQNALASFAALYFSGFDAKKIVSALETFPGVKRRLELITQNDKLIFFDDYAHHPAEIDALVSAVRELYPDKKITGIFQPHLYSRTKDFGEQFGKSLAKLDYPVVTDIYPAREIPIPGIDANWLLELTPNKNKKYVAYSEIPEFVKNVNDGILITIGAGNIEMQVPKIKNTIEQL